ncbi:Internalin protein [Paenibacillus alvei]|uniref:Internalin protein n=2 Tax=Paenibacillus alvei TaxID=44250 RepID=A0A383RCG8_PAEAL|nr:Internalin protein [Paenibacillus alvei]
MKKTFQPLSQMLLAVFHLIHGLDIRWDQKSKELHVVQILSMVDTLRELHLCTYRRVQVYKQTVIDTHSEQLEEDQIKEVLDTVHRTQFLLGRWKLTNRLLVEQLQEHLRYLEDYYKSLNQAFKQAKPKQTTKELKEVVQPIQTVNQVPEEVVQPIQAVNQLSEEVVQPIQTVNRVSKEVVRPTQTDNQVSEEVVQPIQTVNQVLSVIDAVKVGGAVKKRRPSSPPFMSKDVRKPRPQTKRVKVKLPVAPLIVTHHQVNENVVSNQNTIVSKIGSRIYYRK